MIRAAEPWSHRAGSAAGLAVSLDGRRHEVVITFRMDTSEAW
jgi:hypothetical protein